MKRFLILVVPTLLSFSALAQYNPRQAPLPQAPNNAALARFGEYEVSLFTGVPSISIPLHTIKTSGLEVPITLSYHASGIKLHDYPSWVGLGWALDAGGAIRRKLIGMPDEQVHGLLSGEPREAISIDAQDESDVEYMKTLLAGQRDIGADIFSFNFPGANGRFLFDADSGYVPVMLPYSPVKIEKTQTMQQLKFKATDQMGSQMFFDNNFSELTHSINVGNSDNYQTSAWMLEKMLSATHRDSIVFTYQGQYDFTPWDRSDTWFVDDRIDHYEFYTVATAEDDCNNQSYPYDVNPGQQLTPAYSISEMYSYVNDEITFANGRVEFLLDTLTRQDFGQSNTSKALKKIKVYSRINAAEQLIKTIEFFYSYFIDGSDADSKRLRLDSLQVQGLGNRVAETYRFEYNTTQNLPAITTTMMSKDYWGYYNGRSNTSLVPQTTVDYQPFLSSANSTTTIGTTNAVGRETDSVYAQAAILRKIHFPTKGYTEFAYESNRYLDNSTVKLAGGLRVKTIKSYDGYNSNPVIKEYRYGANESGIGRSNIPGAFYHFSEEAPYEFWSRPCPWPYTMTIGQKNDEKRRRLFFSSPTVGLETFDGAPVVYAEVTEFVSDGTSVNGKTVYRFRDSADVIDYIPYSSKPLLSTRHFARGQLANKKLYKSVGGGFQLLQEQRMAYNTSYSQLAVRGGLNLNQQIIRENLTDYEPSYTSSDWFYMDYFIPIDDNYLVADTIIEYHADDVSQSIMTVKNLAYGNVRHQQPISISTVNSKGESVVSEIRYPADYISSGSTTTNTVLDAMLSKHMQAYPVEMWTRKPGAGTVLRGGVNIYRQSSGLIVPDVQKRLQIASPITDYTNGSIVSNALNTDSRYTTMINYPVYESRGNVNEIQKENDVKEIFLWGYNGQFPVAKIVGPSTTFSAASALITQATLDDPSSDAQLRSHLNVLRTGLASAQVTTYTYRPGFGMTSQTDLNGRTTYYEYDYAGRLSLVKDHEGNIVKRICYNLAGQVEDCNCSDTSPSWVNTSTATRCKVNGSNENTGQIEQEQVDANLCSATFNTLQWVVVGTNYGTCPVPCNSYTCVGDDKKCVNGVCETGVRINVGSDYDFEHGMWICYYRYEFSDSSVSAIFSEYTLGACYFN